MAEGRFREDLYYRLNVVEIRMPRARLAPRGHPAAGRRTSCAASPRKNGKTRARLLPRGPRVLENYAWPGNVRELEHAVERAVVLARGDVLEAGDLPETVRKGPLGSAGQLVIPIGTPMEEVERRVIHETLRHTRGDKTPGRPPAGHRRPHHLPQARARGRPAPLRATARRALSGSRTDRVTARHTRPAPRFDKMSAAAGRPPRPAAARLPGIIPSTWP